MSEPETGGTLGECAERLVRLDGDQAYHVAVQMTVGAGRLGDREGERMFAEAARQLLQAGYHRHPKAGH